MEGPLQQVVDESIRLERNVGRLYVLFSRLFEQDSDFWWKIAVEEGHHASMLKSAKAAFIDEGMFPSEVFATTLDTLLALNQEIEGDLTRFEQHSPTRSAALDLAHRLETSAIESCYQEVCETTADTEAHRLFKKLNQENQDHARRNQAYKEEREL